MPNRPFGAALRGGAIGLTCGLGLALAGPHAMASEADGPGIVFELGGGANIQPSYEGSSSYIVSPYPIVRLNSLRLSNGFSIGGGDGLGFSVRPAFGVVAERSAADDPVLAGLAVRPLSVELGLAASYTWQHFRVSGELRYGVSGHNAFVGKASAEAIARPYERLTVTAGPTLSFADSSYMSDYFGVTAAEAAASAFPAYSAGGGFKSAGLAVGARYQINDNWALESSGSWSRLIGDAADSPIVAAGSKDQFTFRIGIARRFRIDF